MKSMRCYTIKATCPDAPIGTQSIRFYTGYDDKSLLMEMVVDDKFIRHLIPLTEFYKLVGVVK